MSGEFWNSIEGAVTAALVALIPVAAAALRAWLRNRTRRWDDAALEAWRQAEDSAPRDATDEHLEEAAAAYLRDRGLPGEKAQALARRTRPTPIVLDRRAIPPPPPSLEIEVEPELDSRERDTQPSPGVKLPRG